VQPTPRCQVDETVERVTIGDMKFPLGVYPVEEMEPRQGYAVDFEPADGADESEPAESDDALPDAEAEWERWPDRYVYDVVISAERVPSLVRHLLMLVPGRGYPILDFIGHDAYREIDPYISYVPIGLDRFIDAIRRYRPFFFEDGMCGFGIMCDEPFLYIFVDEHKIVTIRVAPDLREQIDRILAAFDMQRVAEPSGADGATHEHRGVLVAPGDRPDLLSAEEIVEQLRDEWRLTLNVDPETNVDDDGKPLGLIGWRCLMRCQRESEDRPGYAEVVLYADCLAQAEELAYDAVAGLLGEPDTVWHEPVLLAADRATPEQLAELLGDAPGRTPPRAPRTPTIVRTRFLD
jgi:hypothetical protein